MLMRIRKFIPTPAKAKMFFFVLMHFLKRKDDRLASWVKEEWNQPEPTFESLTSQLVTENQFRSPDYRHWCEEMKETPVPRRKQWEFCYVLQALRQHGLIKQGSNGLGFGVGTEPLPALLARHGCHIVATDQQLEQAKRQGWTTSQEHASHLSMLNTKGICPDDVFNARVTFQVVDMANIPSTLREFDFVWSCCSLEHLGSIDKGIQFICQSLSCLKTGGIAIHTTELNLSSDEHTISKGPTVLFRKQDIARLIEEVQRAGGTVMLVNYHSGTGRLDQHIDVPYYKFNPHYKLLLGSYITTSIGLIIQKIEVV